MQRLGCDIVLLNFMRWERPRLFPGGNLFLFGIIGGVHRYECQELLIYNFRVAIFSNPVILRSLWFLMTLQREMILIVYRVFTFPLLSFVIWYQDKSSGLNWTSNSYFLKRYCLMKYFELKTPLKIDWCLQYLWKPNFWLLSISCFKIIL